MRLILRTQDHQAKLEGQSSITDSEEDFAVVLDGPVIGRIYREPGEGRTRWFWFLQKPIAATGIADTLDAAKDELAVHWRLAGEK